MQFLRMAGTPLARRKKIASDHPAAASPLGSGHATNWQVEARVTTFGVCTTWAVNFRGLLSICGKFQLSQARSHACVEHAGVWGNKGNHVECTALALIPGVAPHKRVPGGRTLGHARGVVLGRSPARICNQRQTVLQLLCFECPAGGAPTFNAQIMLPLP